MKKLSALTLSLLLSLGSFSAVANDDESRGSSADSAFALIDKNGDGAIDKQEARNSGISDERFEKMDRNGDDRLSESEYQGQGSGGQDTGDSWQ